MREWRKIKSDIENALTNYDCDVYYHKPEGHGYYDSCCGYFEVKINEDDWEWDWIEYDLSGVMAEWDLYIDYNSDGDFNLNADWDRYD